MALSSPKQILENAGFKTHLPREYRNDNVVFWQVPELLEQNDRNLPVYLVVVNEINGKKEERNTAMFQERRGAMYDYMNENIVPLINDKYNTNLWREHKSITEKDRDALFQNIFSLVENNCNGVIGTHYSGLCLDPNKIVGLFSKSFTDARRIVDNNIVLANIAMCYSASIENGEPQEQREKIKELYKSTLGLISHRETHLFIPGKNVQSAKKDLNNQWLEKRDGKIEKINYQDVLQENKSIIREARMSSNHWSTF